MGGLILNYLFLLGKTPHWDDTLTMIRVDEPSIVVTLVDIEKYKTDLIG
jgi:hypothetical protein